MKYITKKDLQKQYYERGYYLTLRGNVWYVTKINGMIPVSPGVVRTPILKIYSKARIIQIDDIIDLYKTYVNQTEMVKPEALK